MNIADDLERLICALADIGHARDLGCEGARNKASRLYDEMRAKYPISVQLSVQQSAVPNSKDCPCDRCMEKRNG